ncbi:MAG: UMP kinase [Armatimonadetes bacterium]|nr:UMP kinase [Armatimonadota bacterium]
MSDTGGRRWRRVTLKLSGQALAGSLERQQEDYQIIHYPTVERIASEIAQVRRAGIDVAVVVGGGNIWRGREAAKLGMDEATAHYAGMVATVINALVLQEAIERLGLETRVQTAIEMRQVAEPYIRRRALRHIEKGRVVIFAAGTGNPFFTTDTAAVLRATEINAQVILKATNVDGVYDKDPRAHADAQLIPRLTHLEALNNELRVMDATALSLSMDNKLPIVVFNVEVPGNIVRAAMGEPVGSLVTTEPLAENRVRGQGDE